MVQEKKQDEHPREDEQTWDEAEENETTDPANDEPDESESDFHDEPTSDTDESQAEGSGESKKSYSSLPKRGSRFRKKLLEKIEPISYTNTLEAKDFALESWIDTILNLKASDYLATLQRLVSKKDL